MTVGVLAKWTVPEGGLYFWCRLPARVNAMSVLAECLAGSVSFVPGPQFYVDHAGERDHAGCDRPIMPACSCSLPFTAWWMK